MDQASLTGGDLEAVETGYGTVRRVAEAGCGQRLSRARGGQRSRLVEAGGLAGAFVRAAQCLLRLAWDSEIDWRPIAEPAEPPGTDPYAGWCNRESGRPPTYVDLGVIFCRGCCGDCLT